MQDLTQSVRSVARESGLSFLTLQWGNAVHDALRHRFLSYPPRSYSTHCPDDAL
ncbi:DUF1534 domain-containing protein [Pseudomonas syringae pv. theae]|nr:DUF1534 domain-containing protein [Pseudomonas syringae pv. theae]MBL3833057.1 DUF1534 domain-containing protein [Pseudomonas syringae pv. theae]MBL3866414.1 DUF1534 domain-containing protein [Pseudomonas syringae pv. theae]